jgi:hypothetical protein
LLKVPFHAAVVTFGEPAKQQAIFENELQERQLENPLPVSSDDYTESRKKKFPAFSFIDE